MTASHDGDGDVEDNVPPQPPWFAARGVVAVDQHARSSLRARGAAVAKHARSSVRARSAEPGEARGDAEESQPTLTRSETFPVRARNRTSRRYCAEGLDVLRDRISTVRSEKQPLKLEDEEKDYGLVDKFGRAIARTAAVNAAIMVTGPAGGYATGAAITVKRVHEGAEANDVKEVTKGTAVYAAATTGSCVGQIVGGVIGGACAGPVGVPIGAFTAGCATGITWGAVSEVVVDKMDEYDALPDDPSVLQPWRQLEKSVTEKTAELSKFVTSVVSDQLKMLQDEKQKPVIAALATNVFDLPAPAPKIIRASVVARAAD